MYVIECILDSMRHTSEEDAKRSNIVKSLGPKLSFTSLLAINSRLVERLLKKGIINTEDELFILYGEEQ